MRETTGQWVPGQNLVPNPSVVLVPIADVIEKGEGRVGGSGAEFTAAIRDDLLSHGMKVTMADGESLGAGFESASSFGFAYALKGAITEWEENATEWSSNPDRVALTLELYDAATQATRRNRRAQDQRFLRAFVLLNTHRFVPEIVSHSLAHFFGWRPRVWYK